MAEVASWALQRSVYQALAGSVSHEIALRYLPGVVPARCLRKDARVFHIVSVINVDERNRWLKCLCEERDL